MRFAAAIAFFAGIVAAQSATGAAGAQSTECPAANIVEACLSSTQARLSSCTPNDWGCMCTAQESVVTCYNNCPQDARASSANSTKIQYCQAAAQQSPSSTIVRASTTAVAVSAASSARASGSSSASAQTGAASAIAGSGSGLFAVALGVAALI